MRIIGGRFKGTNLISPKGDSVRPTLDSVREAFFNIIGPNIEGARFLDLYGGSGAVGLEALSRGANHVTIVELEYIDLIQKNSAKCRITTSEEFHVIRGDAMAALAELASRAERFDIVYADPPWNEGAPKSLLSSSEKILADGGQLILEAFHKAEPPTEPAKLKLAKTRRYGDTSLHFYSR